MNHSPEPWSIGEQNEARVDVAAHGVFIAQFAECGGIRLPGRPEPGQGEANAERAVNCVNFLQGIPTESLLLLMSDARWNDVLDDLHSAVDDARRNPIPKQHP